MKKRVLFVMYTMRLGGAEKALGSLLNSMDKDRYDVSLFMFSKEGELLDSVPEWVKVIEADRKSRAMLLEGRYFFKDLIKGFHIGAAFTRLVVYAMTKSRLLKRLLGGFSWKYVAKHVAPLKGHYDAAIGFLEGYTDFFVIDKVDADKKIGWIHIDMSDYELTEYDARYYSQFDEIVTISQTCADAFCGRFAFAKNKIHVVENIVSPVIVMGGASESIGDEWDESVCNIVTVGRLDYQKGYDIAIDACKMLKDRGERVIWHVYGKGVLHDQLQKQISEHGLDDTFLLEGIRKNPYPYMKKADIIVQPSRFEGKSIVLDEAKILGKPIVVTNYASVADQITDGVTGVIVDIDPKSVADGIERVVHDKELAKRLSDNCLLCENKSLRAIDDVYEIIDKA